MYSYIVFRRTSAVRHYNTYTHRWAFVVQRIERRTCFFRARGIIALEYFSPEIYTRRSRMTLYYYRVKMYEGKYYTRFLKYLFSTSKRSTRRKNKEFSIPAAVYVYCRPDMFVA